MFGSLKRLRHRNILRGISVVRRLDIQGMMKVDLPAKVLRVHLS